MCKQVRTNISHLLIAMSYNMIKFLNNSINGTTKQRGMQCCGKLKILTEFPHGRRPSDSSKWQSSGVNYTYIAQTSPVHKTKKYTIPVQLDWSLLVATETSKNKSANHPSFIANLTSLPRHSLPSIYIKTETITS